MPFDTQWSVLHILNDISSQQHSSYRQSPSTWLVRRDNVRPPVFNPGDIAHVRGGVNGAFYETLVRLGITLNRDEAETRDWIAQSNTGKYCVVLSREDADSYWVCYLSRFTEGARTGRISSPAGRFFGLAFGGTQQYPPGFTPLRTAPRWTEPCYVFAAPVLRKGLEISRTHVGRANPWGLRMTLEAGELKRVVDHAQSRFETLKTDPRALSSLRKEMAEQKELIRQMGGFSAVEFLDEDTLMRPASVSHTDFADDSVDEATRGVEDESSFEMLAIQRSSMVQPKAQAPVLSHLPVPDAHNLVYLLGWARTDISTSYSALHTRPSPSLRVETKGQQQWRVHNEQARSAYDANAIERLTARRYAPPFVSMKAFFLPSSRSGAQRSNVIDRKQVEAISRWANLPKKARTTAGLDSRQSEAIRNIPSSSNYPEGPEACDLSQHEGSQRVPKSKLAAAEAAVVSSMMARRNAHAALEAAHSAFMLSETNLDEARSRLNEALRVAQTISAAPSTLQERNALPEDATYLQESSSRDRNRRKLSRSKQRGTPNQDARDLSWVAHSTRTLPNSIAPVKAPTRKKPPTSLAPHGRARSGHAASDPAASARRFHTLVSRFSRLVPP